MRKLFVVMLSVVMIAPLCACSMRYNRYQTYVNSQNYTVGGAVFKDVQALDIHWLSGNVKLVADDAALSIAETTDDNLDEDLQLHYWLEEGTLHIHFAASGAKVPDNLQKALVVKVPRRVLQNIDVQAVSADVALDAVSCTRLNVETVSGNAVSTGATASNTAVETTSGRIQLWDSIADNLSIESVSGNVVFNSATAPAAIDAETVSGDILISLPSATGVQCTHKTVSGSFSNRLPKGSQCVVKVETISGDISLLTR